MPITVADKIKLNKAEPDLDHRYGPYDSLKEAYAKLGPTGADLLCVGLTVGIRSSDGTKIDDYWFRGGIAFENLVRKSIEFTDEQQAALDSGATAERIAAISTLETDVSELQTDVAAIEKEVAGKAIAEGTDGNLTKLTVDGVSYNLPYVTTDSEQTITAKKTFGETVYFSDAISQTSRDAKNQFLGETEFANKLKAYDLVGVNTVAYTGDSVPVLTFNSTEALFGDVSKSAWLRGQNISVNAVDTLTLQGATVSINSATTVNGTFSVTAGVINGGVNGHVANTFALNTYYGSSVVGEGSLNNFLRHDVGANGTSSLSLTASSIYLKSGSKTEITATEVDIIGALALGGNLTVSGTYNTMGGRLGLNADDYPFTVTKSSDETQQYLIFNTDGSMAITSDLELTHGILQSAEDASNQIGSPTTFASTVSLNVDPINEKDAVNLGYLATNYVDATSTETIGGAKTFSNRLYANAGITVRNNSTSTPNVTILPDYFSYYPTTDSTLVYTLSLPQKSGTFAVTSDFDEYPTLEYIQDNYVGVARINTITGDKTFSANVYFKEGLNVGRTRTTASYPYLFIGNDSFTSYASSSLSYTLSVPQKSGTVAIEEDVVDLSTRVSTLENSTYVYSGSEDSFIEDLYTNLSISNGNYVSDNKNVSLLTRNPNNEAEFVKMNFLLSAGEHQIITADGESLATFSVDSDGYYNVYYKPDGDSSWTYTYVYAEFVEAAETGISLLSLNSVLSNWYLRGSFDAWSTGYRMYETDSLAVYWGVYLPASTEFKVYDSSSSSWYPAGSNLSVAKSGFYDITLSKTDYSVSVSKAYFSKYYIDSKVISFRAEVNADSCLIWDAEGLRKLSLDNGGNVVDHRISLPDQTSTLVTEADLETYATEAYVDEKATEVASGNVATASALQTARSISLGTGAVGTATDFDGSADITIPVTKVKEAYLDWGGKNFANSCGPIDAAMIPELGANRFAFLPAAGVTAEYSRDGGSTWTDYDATDSMKVGLFSRGTDFTVGCLGSGETATSDYQLRITVDSVDGYVYSTLNKFALYVSTNGSTGCTCTISIAKNSDTSTYETIADSVSITGWPGYNIINVTEFTTYKYNSNHYQKIRFLFKIGGQGSVGNGLAVSRIAAFGGMGWSTPSNLARHGHIYNYDVNQNVTFPANVTAAYFYGTFSGNASTATKLASSHAVQTDLTSSSSASFDGSADIAPGVTGVLSIANGGTGASSAEEAISALGITATVSELNCVDGVTSNIQTQIDAVKQTAIDAGLTFADVEI